MPDEGRASTSLSTTSNGVQKLHTDPDLHCELDLPDLRSWKLWRFPYLIFYVARGEYIDVWCVLHAERDIPAWMREPGSE
jgi:proteasome lid subunit RPN8/RPN11